MNHSQRPVASVETILGSPEVVHLFKLIRVRMGFTPESFELAVQPLLPPLVGHIGTADAAVASLLQALHAGIWALDARRERILPPQVAPEDLGAVAHGWTYAVLVAALLLGLSRDSQADEALAWTMYQSFVPGPVQHWLQSHDALVPRLQEVLMGKASNDNPIAAVLRDAGVLPRQVVRHGVSASSGASGSNTEKKTDPAIPPTGLQVQEEPALPAVASLPAVERWPPGLAGEFLQWLRDGIASGTLPVNARDGLVHRVAEGLLLVSPAVFRAYLAQQPLTESGAGEDGEGAFRRVQKALLKLGWHLVGEGGVTMHAYARGHSRRMLQGIVLTRPQCFLDASPVPDAALQRLPATHVGR